MTVDELLRQLSGAFPAFDAKRLESWGPIFRAAFEKREGPHLAAAYTACLLSFEPKKAGKLFPTPPDISAHMPSLRDARGKDDKPIREMLERRQDRARNLTTLWLEGQGAKIKQSRAQPLYAACLLEAMEQAKARALDERITGIVLSQAQINECYQRALSSERAKRFGRPERYTGQQWWSQITAIASEWGIEIAPEWWSKDTAKALSAAMETQAA